MLGMTRWNVARPLNSSIACTSAGTGGLGADRRDAGRAERAGRAVASTPRPTLWPAAGSDVFRLLGVAKTAAFDSIVDNLTTRLKTSPRNLATRLFFNVSLLGSGDGF